MTFKELKEEVNARGFEHITEARIKRWLNQAYREIADYRAWAFLEESKEGVSPLTIADLGHVLSVTDITNETKLRYVERAALVQFDPALVRTGSASQWYLDGITKLVVYPEDTVSTLSVRYLRLVAELVLDADKPVIPVAYQGLIVDGACVRGYKDTDNYEAGAFLRKEFNHSLRSMVKGLRINYDNPRLILRTGTINDYMG